MAVFSFTDRSVFVKIYAGLLLVCASVMCFSYLFITTINDIRLQSYHENVVSGLFYLLTQGIERQSDDDRFVWLADASSLFGDNFYVLPESGVEFKARELRRLRENKAVVRYENSSGHMSVYQKLKGSDEILTVKLTQMGDRQARAMGIFLLDDLSYYPTASAKNKRMQELSRAFGHKVQLESMYDLNLDASQLMRLQSGDAVLMFTDGSATQGSTMTLIAPSQQQDVVIVAGPIALFHWFPANLLLSAALIAMLLIGVGVYALIFPLERRLSLLQKGVDAVSQGNLDTAVQVVGQDDIARLSSTFNTMIAQIKRLIEAQRELTRAVSHELRTPVARIRFAVDMLADTDDAPSREAQKQDIDRDIESLNELIDEILTYAKLEEGSPRLDWQMVDLRALIEQIVKETNALGKPIEVRYTLPPAKAAAMADRRYLHRVVQNFAGNALRYAKNSIIISAGIQKGMAFVSVEDDGQGIAEADRKKVFIPFARLDDSRTRSSGGYGLGLSIVGRIAFWFHGEVSVDQSPNLGGARFTMTWPVRQVGITILADAITQASSEKKLIGDRDDRNV